jgi:hypothetical protein
MVDMGLHSKCKFEMPIHTSHVISPEYMTGESWLGDFMCWKFEQRPDLIREVSICHPSPALDTNVFKSRLQEYTTRLGAEPLSASIVPELVACTYKFSQQQYLPYSEVRQCS